MVVEVSVVMYLVRLL